MDWEKISRTLTRVLVKAGYKIDAYNASQSDILTALSDYESKHDDMMEHILMEIK